MPQERNTRSSRPDDREGASRPRTSAPRRRRGTGAAVSFALLYVVLVIGISVVLACVGWIAANDILALNKEEREVTITVSADDSFGDVVDMLEENGLIDHKFLFKMFSAVTGGEEKISRGTFTLNTDMDYRALISGMGANSTSRAKVSITIPEGYTQAQIFQLLEEKGVATVEELEYEAANHDYDFSFLQDLPLGEPTRLEGYLYPDTYEFYTPHNPRYVINKMLVNFDARFTETMRKQVADSGRTIHEILTVAAMIEKETDGTDRGKIASVIYNRLENPGYETVGLLQIDATIYYITGRTVTQADRETLKSPYNTHINKGLPPGPIASPGMNSIQAAISPEKTSWYYYALGDDGVHHYYKTYKGLQDFLATQKLYK